LQTKRSLFLGGLHGGNGAEQGVLETELVERVAARLPGFVGVDFAANDFHELAGGPRRMGQHHAVIFACHKNHSVRLAGRLAANAEKRYGAWSRNATSMTSLFWRRPWSLSCFFASSSGSHERCDHNA